MARRQILGAPYNPRVIDDFAKKALRDKLKKRGLLNALVVNRRTGNLVSGHQRLAILDMLEGSDDYALDVDVVDLSPSQEREENVFFNNPHAQGQFDPLKLAEVLKAPELKLDDTGFTPTALQVQFAGTILEELFKPGPIGGIQHPGIPQKGTEEPPDEDDDTEDAGPDAEGEERFVGGRPLESPEKLAHVLQQREETKARMESRAAEADSEFMIILVCADRNEREAVAQALGGGPNDTMLDALAVVEHLGLTLEATDTMPPDEAEDAPEPPPPTPIGKARKAKGAA